MAEPRRRLWTAAACCRFKVWKLASRPLPEQAPANQSGSELPHSKERPFVHATAVRLFAFPFTLLPLPFALRRRRSGFTLIEILVALVLLALTLVLLIYPFISATNFLGKGRTRADVQRVAAQAMDTMVREISQAMQVELNSADPTICAFVLPDSTTFPLQPKGTVVRYWSILVKRGASPGYDTSANPSLQYNWYEKFNPDPKKNLSSMNDKDSRFIARTELAGPLSVASLSRATPPATADPIQNKQAFIALSPNRENCDVPILRFEMVRQPTATTPALLKITLTISERDPKSGTPQDMHLERLVELKNVTQ